MTNEGADSDGWYRWRPARAASAAYEDIAEAIESFTPIDNEAGQMSAKWLREESLSNYPTTATWLLYGEKMIQGFVAICSGNVTLHDSGRTNAFRRRIKGLPGVRYAGELEPASEIRWIARHAEAEGTGTALISQASRIAEQVAEIQGNTALVIDPYDRETADMLREKYPFFWSARLGQLWLRLPEPEELAQG